jgi:hypothetical protein
LIENIGGIMEQLPVARELFRGTMQATGVDPKKVKEARTRARQVTARLLSSITGEESGRFTDAERKIAETVQSTLDPTASDEQIEVAMDTVTEITFDAAVRDVNNVALALEADLRTPDGINKVFSELTRQGLSEATATQLLVTSLQARGMSLEQIQALGNDSIEAK